MKDLIRSSVAALSGYVPGEQSREPGIIKLNTNENPYPPSAAINDVLAATSIDELRLYPNPTGQQLRQAIAELHSCTVDNVFVGNGGDEILALCTRAFVEPDGNIGYFIPSYSLYPVLAEIRDVRVTPLDLADDFTWPSVADDYSASLFFLTNPNAPTGLLYKQDEVIRFCERSTGVVVIDEAYVDFASADSAGLAVELDNVLVARTLSKAYSLAGIRMGYALGPEPLISALFKLKDSYNTDMLAQRIAMAALNDRSHMQANVAKIKATRARLSEALQLRDFLVLPSETNFVFARPGAVAAGALFEYLRQHKILVRYFPGDRTGEYLRITVGADEEIDALLAAIDECLSLQGQ